jgi:ribosomal protein S18 acetylase RimI-like enzyme
MVLGRCLMQDPRMPSVETPAWGVRGARADDRRFLFDLNEATMRDYVDATWGWDDDEQLAFFDEHFDPSRCQLLQVEGADIGVLAIVERPDEIYLAEIQLLPEWQCRGIGSAVVGSLVERGAAEAKPVTLRVMRTNPRAAALYARLGFQPFREIETHIYMRREP